MEPLPKMAITTPSHNQERVLEHATRPMLDQGCPNLENVVINGGSTDGNQDIIACREQQLGYWVSEKDCGLCDPVYRLLSTEFWLPRCLS